ncbi:uncharacterized protein LOC111401775 isoform X1 [Olea europaea var. sylvestris]|uniref:uncharacterized protein LOC111401775 isoform X1 n=2 Tax=Olea europaea var. sylvestris TaxID=158386 RepID=UPI000C1D8C2B|nr:uncharacterized protein LOC111401775 isoform X1 [Olea europaea var. sylvestris]
MGCNVSVLTHEQGTELLFQSSKTERMNMRRLLGLKWIQFCNLLKFSQPTSQKTLRDKAIAVAGRVTVKKDGEHSKVSCPVCLNVIRAPLDSDLRMILAVHLSLWHPDDVKLQWEIMQNKNQSNLHMPSLVIGVGIAAAIGALLSLSAKHHPRPFPAKTGR